MIFPEAKTNEEKIAAILSIGFIRRLYEGYKRGESKRNGMYVFDIGFEPLPHESRNGVYGRLQFQDGANFCNAVDWLVKYQANEWVVIRLTKDFFMSMLYQLNNVGYDETIEFDQYTEILAKEIEEVCNSK